MIQDSKGKRELPKESFINVQWFMDIITKQCNYCGCGFTIDIYKGSVPIAAYCHGCNGGLKNYIITTYKCIWCEMY